MKKINKKIKLFIFIDSFRIGGMHRQMLFLVKHINKELFEPIVCTSGQGGGLKSDFEKIDCKLICLDWKGRYDFGIIFRLLNVLKIEQPDIVFITEVHNLVYYQLAKLFWKKKVIQIGSYRALTFWLSHENKKYHFIDNIFSKWLYNSSHFITTNSYALKSHYSKIVNPNSNKEIQVIYNGSDFNFVISKKCIEIREELGICLNDVLIVMIARLDPWKDFITFLEAAKIVIQKEPNTKFIVVGDGELRDFLEKKIFKLNLQDNVMLIGEKNEIYNYHNIADISILSSNGEGFSNSILEAMALSKPVIATDIGGNSELIGITGECGILVPLKSPKILADEILRLVCDKGYRDKMGKSAKVRIYELCNIVNYISSYESLFLKSMNFLNKIS